MIFFYVIWAIALVIGLLCVIDKCKEDEETEFY